jgi:uncharacterized membrane protein YsdA (DUF1294 family)
MYIQEIVIGLFLTINITSFAIMAYDKRKSVHNHSTKRTPEGYLFFLASVFGAIGVYLAMLAFRHKTKRWYFQIGIPLLIVQNLVTIYQMQQLLSS